jgi:phosphoglycolate phosphatase
LLLIFDLDGTLIDSSADLAISMNATREYLGMPPLDPGLIYSYVGNGAAVLVRRAIGHGASEEMAAEALTYFLKFYRTHALEHTKLYPGIENMIHALSLAGHKLAVLTNKPVRISSDIIAALGLQSHFFRVYGGDSFAQKKPDPIGILALMDETRESAPDILMVGDSGVDVQTARNAGVRSCGVAWGFQPQAFQVDRPDLLIEKPEELLNHVGPAVAAP